MVAHSRRSVQVIALTLWLFAACAQHGGSGACTYQGRTYAVGDEFPAGDNCNHCTCTTAGVSCSKLACSDAGVDAPPGSCMPSGGCLGGPACGSICCASGEHCDNGACLCGTGSACPSGDSCAPPGPLGGDACGALCCGATGPCPQ